LLIRHYDAQGFLNTASIITTVAGNNALSFGYSGDGGLATAAKLNYPHGFLYASFACL